MAAPNPIPDASAAKATATQAGPLSEEQITAAAGRAQRVLDDLWDPKEGGWGTCRRSRSTGTTPGRSSGARRPRRRAHARALHARPAAKIIDPVWGGIYQYSTDGDWLHPHFEKLMTFQAGALDNYATAFALTGEPHGSPPRSRSRLHRSLHDEPRGGFYATKDADLNAHDPSKPLVTGHDYYAKDDAARRALGIPRVDTHEYGRENGLVIAAYVTLAQAGHDASALATAERAAARILATHSTSLGGIAHAGADDLRVLYLADSAAFGFALRAPLRGDREPSLLGEREAHRRVPAARAAGSRGAW